MKSRILLLVLIVSSIYSCSNEKKNEESLNKKENALTKASLNGKVKCIEESHFIGIEKFGEIKKSLLSTKINDNFDKNGNLTGISEGFIYYSVGYTRQTYEYDENGNMIEHKTFKSSDSLETKEAYVYDENGGEIEYNRYNSKDSLLSKAITKNDEYGDWVEVNVYSAEGDLTYFSTCKRDEKGNIIEWDSWSQNGSVKGKETYRYDEHGNVIDFKSYNSDGVLCKNETFNYKYDEHGLKIEKNCYSEKGILFDKYTYKYDNHGNLVEENNYNSDESLTRKKINNFEYDKSGNWTRKTSLTRYYNEEMKADCSIAERIIEYYP